MFIHLSILNSVTVNHKRATCVLHKVFILSSFTGSPTRHHISALKHLSTQHSSQSYLLYQSCDDNSKAQVQNQSKTVQEIIIAIAVGTNNKSFKEWGHSTVVDSFWWLIQAPTHYVHVIHSGDLQYISEHKTYMLKMWLSPLIWVRFI